MFKRVLIILAVLTIYAVVAVNAQDSATDAPTPAPESTQVVNLPPATVEPPVVVVNNPPAESPFTPTVVMAFVVIGALVLVIVSKESTIRTAIVQLGASAPAFGYAGAKTTILEGVTSLEGVVAKTETKLDDAAVAEIKAIVLGLLAEVDARRGLSLNSSEKYPVGLG